jgi:hypothetical protein
MLKNYNLKLKIVDSSDNTDIVINSKPVKYDNYMKDKRDILLEWLRSRCLYNNDIFCDPGYSDSYKREFNIIDGLDYNIKIKSFYSNDSNLGIDIDIDQEISEYNENYKNLFDYDDIADINTHLVDFIDYIPASKLPDILHETVNNNNIGFANFIISKLSLKPMCFFPGTNHSNANFLYKKAIRFISNTASYNIPFVSADVKSVYKGDHKTSKMNINKEKFYEFLMDQSK